MRILLNLVVLSVSDQLNPNNRSVTFLCDILQVSDYKDATKILKTAALCTTFHYIFIVSALV